MSVDMSLHSRTPLLLVAGPRGEAVRTVAYHRSDASATAEPRVSRSVFDAAGRAVEDWDPRLGALRLAQRQKAPPAGDEPPVAPNHRHLPSLSGQALRSDSVDAGWTVVLPGAAGEQRMSWDARGTIRRFRYDSMLRSVEEMEQTTGGPERCIGRSVFHGPEAASTFACGALKHAYDTAGLQEYMRYDLSGQPAEVSQVFLRSLDEPDWPEEAAMADVLLEHVNGDMALPLSRHTTTWHRDACGAALTQVDARGHKQHFSYAVSGEAASIGVSLATAGAVRSVMEHADYDANGQLLSHTAGACVIASSYDPMTGRLVRSLATNAGGKALHDIRYDYDPAGNVLRMDDISVSTRYWGNRVTDGTTTYAYDTLYQLVASTGRESNASPGAPDLPGYRPPGDPSVTVPYTETYAYDAGGNLTTLSHTGQPRKVMAVAPHSNRSVLQEKGDVPDVESCFDARGNQRELQRGQPMIWNARDQLAGVIAVTRANRGMANDEEAYVYGGDGMRRRKQGTAVTGGGSHTAEVRYLPGLELRRNSVGNEALDVIVVEGTTVGVQVLHWTSGQPAEVPNDQFRYRVSNHQGSATTELDDQAQIVSQETYYPYGGTAWRAARNAVEADYRTVRYSGQERDATGLYYYGFRYYAPWLNRWINPDPAGATDGLNLFAFARNNPSTYIDENGLAVFGTLDDDLLRLRKARKKGKQVLPDVLKATLANAMNSTPGAAGFVEPEKLFDIAIKIIHKDTKEKNDSLKELAAMDAAIARKLAHNPDVVRRAQEKLAMHNQQVRNRALAAAARSASSNITLTGGIDPEDLLTLWATNKGSAIIQSGVGADRKISANASVREELRGTVHQDEYETMKGRFKRVADLGKRRPTELAAALNEYIGGFRPGTDVYFRGMPSDSHMKVGSEYEPGTFFSASTNIDRAGEFGGPNRIIVEIQGKGTFIPSIYEKRNEQEVIFPSTAVYKVGRSKNGQMLKLTHIR